MTKGRNAADPNHRLAASFDAFMRRRRATLTCVIKDRSYSTMQIFSVPPAASVTVDRTYGTMLTHAVPPHSGPMDSG